MNLRPLKIIKNENEVASHKVVQEHIDRFGEDYRVQDKPHPIKSLDNRNVDNTSVGRKQ